MLLTVTRPHPRPADRRAHRAEPALPPVRHRHAHPALGRTRSRAPARRSATPARRRPACARWRSTRCAAAAASTTGCRCRTPRWSRTTTWSPPAGSPRRSTRSARRLPGPADRGRGRHARPAAPGLVEAGAELILLDNFTAGRRCAQAVTLVAHGRARLARVQRRADPGSARAVAETGVDYLAVGALTHSAPVLDIGWTSVSRDSPPPRGLLNAARDRRRQHQHRPRPVRGRGDRRALADQDRRRAAPPTRSPSLFQGLLGSHPLLEAGRRRRHRDVLDGAVGAARDARDVRAATTATCPR